MKPRMRLLLPPSKHVSQRNYGLTALFLCTCIFKIALKKQAWPGVSILLPGDNYVASNLHLAIT